MQPVRKDSMGWMKDFPDIRDFTPFTDNIPERSRKRGVKHTVKELLSEVGFHASKTAKKSPKSKTKVDLRKWCSPIEDQGNIGSCTAHATTALLEYYERRAHGIYIDASRLFLYKASRNLLRWHGDRGAHLRAAIGALALFGVPPEEYWPYNVSKFDEEPSAFCYSFAQNFKAISYYRLDPPHVDPHVLLDNIKSHMSKGLPLVFGFTCYNSMEEASDTGAIPFPSKKDKVDGGHAVMAVGYDDGKKIRNSDEGSADTTGAILIRNSWGPDWGGMGGYLWLPYEYILQGLADDWWTLIKNEWIETGQFGE
ncbi:MAG TPA: C1 family peptidase [Chitinophagales bacterium]|nr:C1 family peptidase [Chitinophagales bacterium]